jgi:hypothetical protein
MGIGVSDASRVGRAIGVVGTALEATVSTFELCQADLIRGSVALITGRTLRTDAKAVRTVVAARDHDNDHDQTKSLHPRSVGRRPRKVATFVGPMTRADRETPRSDHRLPTVWSVR